MRVDMGAGNCLIMRLRTMNGTIPYAVFLAVFLLLPAMAQSQASNNAATNQPLSQSLQTNLPPPEAVDTNLLAPLPTLPTNQFPIAPAPLTAPFQSTVANFGAPASAGAGRPESPLLGNSSVGAPDFAGEATPATPGIYRYGPIDLHAHVIYSFSDATELQSGPGSRTSTVVNSVAPGLTLNLGSQWAAGYTRIYSFYSGAGYHNTTGDYAFLSGTASNADWQLTLAQTYSSLSLPLVETGAQTEEEAYVTALSVTHPLSEKWSVTLAGNQTFRFADPYTDIRAWTGSADVNYVVNSMLRAGLSFSGGYDAINQGTDITFESLQGTLVFHPGAKTLLAVSGGGERQQFSTAGMPSLLTPVFSADLQYALFRSTTISVNAVRTVTPSFFANQDNVLTMVNAGVEQKLCDKISLILNGGHSSMTYTTLAAGPLPAFYIGFPPIVPLNEQVRSDSSTFIRVSLAYRFRPSLRGSVYYMELQNTSSQGAFGFNTSQVGLQLSYQY